jgi:hypothetical protein
MCFFLASTQHNTQLHCANALSVPRFSKDCRSAFWACCFVHGVQLWASLAVLPFKDGTHLLTQVENSTVACLPYMTPNRIAKVAYYWGKCKHRYGSEFCIVQWLFAHDQHR